MNHECEFAGMEYCMCETCRSMRKMLEDMKKMDTEKCFEEADRLLKKVQEETGCNK